MWCGKARTDRALRLALITACVWAGVLGTAGCASAPSENPVAPGRLAPVAPARAGIDIVRYAVDDSKGVIGRTLASASRRPVPISAADVRRWRDAGLRLVAVSAQEAEKLLAELSVAGPVQRQQSGLLNRWTPLATGAAWRSPRWLTVGEPGPQPSAPVVLKSGRLRLLGRCWETPVFDDTGVRTGVRLELVPQHEEESPSLDRVLNAPDRAIDRSGRVFDELRVGWTAGPDEVFLIVPESPGADWASPEDVSNDRPGAPGVAPGEDGEPRPVSVGEAMLTDAGAESVARIKVILVLAPGRSRRFDLGEPPAVPKVPDAPRAGNGVSPS